jgi:hypothetical protein
MKGMRKTGTKEKGSQQAITKSLIFCAAVVGQETLLTHVLNRLVKA